MKIRLAYLVVVLSLVILPLDFAFCYSKSSNNILDIPEPYSKYKNSRTILLPLNDKLKKDIDSEVPNKKISIKTRHLMGDFTENVMDRFFQGKGKWKKINSQVGKNGIDGLYTRQKNGRVKVLVVESKYNKSQLSQNAKKGAQGSKKWIENSIDERIESLKKVLNNSNIDLKTKNGINSEIQQLQAIKNNGSYVRRVFSAQIIDGKLSIELADIEEYIDRKNGKLRTRKAPVTIDNVEKKASGLWSIDKKGVQHLDIPLSTEEYRNLRVSKNLNTNQKKYLSQLRETFFNDLKEKLVKEGMHSEDAQKIIKNFKRGTITNSIELNKAIDSRIISSEKSLAKSLRMKGFTESQVNRLIGLSKVNIPGKKFLVKKTIFFQQGINSIKNITRKVYSGVKSPKYNLKQAYSKIKNVNFSTVKKSLKNGSTYKQAGKYTFRSIIIITAAIEIYQNVKFWQDFSRGYHTTHEAYSFAGKTVGIFTGAYIGASVGAKIGFAIGAPFGGVGAPVGSAIGSFVGATVGAIIGAITGDYFGDRAYSFFNDVKDEEYRTRYVDVLERYCFSNAFKI